MFYKTKKRLGTLFDHPELVVAGLRERMCGLARYWQNGSRALLPSQVKIYINSVCDGHCSFCDVGRRNKESMFTKQIWHEAGCQMSIEAARQIAAKLAVFLPRVNIAGLEPLMHPSMGEIIHCFKLAGLYTDLTTNGGYLEKWAEEILRVRLNAIGVSLDGPAAVHDAIRGEGMYERAFGGIKKVVGLRKSLGVKIGVGVQCCIHPANVSYLVEHAKVLLQSGVDSVGFIHPYWVTEQARDSFNRRFSKHLPPATTVSEMIPKEINERQLDLLWKQMVQLRSTAFRRHVRWNIDFANRESLLIYYQRPGEQMGKKHCEIPWNRATVLADGEMVIHNRCVNYSVGNLLEQPFSTIWNGPLYGEFRRILRQEGRFSICERCCGVVAK